MKEFIEKLISRLEEKKNRYQELAYDSNFDGWAEEEKQYLAKEEMCEEIIEIINELTKKYNKKYEPAIDLIEYGVDGYNLHLKEQYRKGYEDAKKDNDWIPCSEKLPKANIQVIVTAEKDGHKYTTDAYFYNGKFYNKHYYKIPVGELNNSSVGDNVLAWQPLPAPYEEVNK